MNEEQNEVSDALGETPEEVTSVDESTDSETPTLEDYQRLLKENKTLKFQKEQFRQKAKQTLNNTNTTTLDKAEIEKMFLKRDGLSDEIIAEAEAVAKGKGIDLISALKTPAIEAMITLAENETRRSKAQLGASGGSRVSPSGFTGTETPEEHRAKWEAMHK